MNETCLHKKNRTLNCQRTVHSLKELYGGFLKSKCLYQNKSKSQSRWFQLHPNILPPVLELKPLTSISLLLLVWEGTLIVFKCRIPSSFPFRFLYGELKSAPWTFMLNLNVYEILQSPTEWHTSLFTDMQIHQCSVSSTNFHFAIQTKFNAIEILLKPLSSWITEDPVAHWNTSAGIQLSVCTKKRKLLN